MQSVLLLMVLILFVQCSARKATVSGGEKLAKSTLWKITGDDIKDSYLFGTVHIYPKEDFKLSTAAKNAFAESELVVMELDMDDPMMAFSMLTMVRMEDDKSLDDFLNAEDIKLLKKSLESSLMPYEMVKSWKPIMLTSLLMGSVVDGPTTSFEEVFVAMASKQGKEIEGLETVEQQMKVMDGSSYEEQLKDILELLREPETSKEEYEGLIKLYRKQDITSMYELTVQEMEQEARKTMLDDRNKTWIPQIKEKSAEESTFYAVGAGHLAGPNGVINLLKEAGYKVVPIKK